MGVIFIKKLISLIVRRRTKRGSTVPTLHMFVIFFGFFCSKIVRPFYIQPVTNFDSVGKQGKQNFS